MRDRGLRRQRETKRKTQVAALFQDVYRQEISPEFLVRQASTRKKCSCALCGNFRRRFKGRDKLTIQEKRHE